jgi:glyoxylase-like metal-dependent hydrolase (beta-lactamase superfamily II)
MTATERGALEHSVAMYENQTRELSAFEYAPPTLLFSNELRLDLGGRTVRVLNFGRGNTPGDTVIFLPAERVLAAGDLVVAPVPYAYNSYPRDWVGVMRQLRALEPAIIVPGHGAVQHDTVYVRQVEDLLRSVVDQVDALEAEGKTLEDIRKAIDVAKFRKTMAGEDAAANELFDDSIVRALVERAFTSARGGV